MKIISVLLLLLGCSQVESESEEDLTENKTYKEYSTENLNFHSPSNEIRCPVYVKNININNLTIQIEIPAECSKEFIDKGRPPEESVSVEEELIFEHDETNYIYYNDNDFQEDQ